MLQLIQPPQTNWKYN